MDRVDQGMVREVFELARDTDVVAIALPGRLIAENPTLTSDLRDNGVLIIEEIRRKHDHPRSRSGEIDGVLVMLIDSGTKQQADTTQLTKVQSLSTNYVVGIDGGVTRTLATTCVDHGAKYMVSGRDLFTITEATHE